MVGSSRGLFICGTVMTYLDMSVLSVTSAGRSPAKCAHVVFSACMLDQFYGFIAHLVLHPLLLGYVKDITYETPVTSLDELKLRIVAVFKHLEGN